MEKQRLRDLFTAKNTRIFLSITSLLFFYSISYAQAPQFGPATAYELGGQSPKDLEVQDLNYDGHLDMVSVTSTKINFLLGDGNGRLLKDNSITMGDVNDVEFADFNNDGFFDMAIARGGLSSSPVNGIDIYLGTGGEAPQFVFKRLLLTHQDSGPIVLGDFNEDGNVDVIAQGIVANLKSGMGIFFGLGNGTFSTPVQIGSSRDFLSDLEAVDFNSDGHLDLIGGGVSLGDGSGKFSGGGNGLHQSAVGDLNNDGLLDVVGNIQSYSGPVGIQVSLQQSDGSYLHTLTNNSGTVAEIGIADFDRDTKGDVLIRFTNGDLIVFEVNADGSLNTGEAINTIPYQGRLWSQHFVLADFNEDGFVDLASPDWLLTHDSSIWVQLQTPNLFKDTEAPQVVISSIHSGDVLAYKHALTATTTDNTDVIRVEYFLNDQLIGKSAGPEFLVKWDTRSVVDGTYNLTATAVDGFGNHATSNAINVSVNNSKPTIISSHPLTLQKRNVGETIAYHVIASGDGPITYSLNNPLVGMSLDPDTGVLKWIPLADQLGIQTISIQADNSAGSDTQNFDVEVVDTIAPQRTPNIRTEDVTQTSVTIAWDEAKDNVGTIRYSLHEYIYVSRFSSHYNLIADNITEKYFTITGLKPGSLHKYTVQAYDAAGNVLDLPRNYPRYKLSHGIGVITLSPPVVYHPISSSGEIVNATVGKLFKYIIGSFGSPKLSIVSGPAGMVLKGSYIYWVPAHGQEGNVTVTVEGVNTEGSHQHTFSFPVYASTLENNPPVIVSVTGAPGFDYWPNNNTNLDAFVLDDGMPDSDLSYEWSTQSGPDSALFSQEKSAITDVTFPMEGTYQLLLTVSDGDLETLYPVSYTVYPARPAIKSPYVGTTSGLYNDIIITLPLDNTLLTSVVIGADTFGWKLVQSPGLADFIYRKGATNYVLADAFFSGPGEYVLELSASNGELVSSYTQHVIVNPEPVPVAKTPTPDPVPDPTPEPIPEPDPIPDPNPEPQPEPDGEQIDFKGTIEEVGSNYLIVTGNKVYFDNTTEIEFEDGSGDVFAIGQEISIESFENTDGSFSAIVIQVG